VKRFCENLNRRAAFLTTSPKTDCHLARDNPQQRDFDKIALCLRAIDLT
jgi:hypothetical protein